MWGCVDESIDRLIATDNDDKTVVFSIKVPGSDTPKSSEPTTYALTEKDETDVTQVAVLLFDIEGNYVYQPIYRGGSNITTNPDDTRIKTFTIKVPEGTYDMVVLANSNESLNSALGSIEVGQSRDVVLSKILLTKNEKWNAAPGSENYIHIPMWGEVSSITVSSSMPTNVPVTLVRMVAKIDVALTTATAKNKFDLTSVRLYNYNNKGQIVPNNSNWDRNSFTVTAPSIPSSATKPANPLISAFLYEGDAITKDTNGGTTRGVSCINEIYTFEATAGSDSSLPDNTCIVIGGRYDKDNQITYYRIDFANTTGSEANATTNYLPLLRNHNYKVNIANVKASGYPTPEEAFSSRPVNIEANIINWSDAQITEIVFDGQYMLGVSKGEFSFSSEEYTVSSQNNALHITTDYPGGWNLKKIVNDSGREIRWLKLSETSGQAGITSTTKLLLERYMFGNSPRIAFIHLSAGRLTYIIKLVQAEESDIEKRSLSITNESGEEINLLEFGSKVDVQPAQQKFNITWQPTFPPLSYTNTAMGNGFLFDTSEGHDKFKESGYTRINLGAKSYTIRSTVITSDEVATDPFYERNSYLLFTIVDDTVVINKSLVLRQYAYNMIPLLDDKYVMDNPNGIKSFGVRTNTLFTVSKKADPDGVMIGRPSIQSVGTDASVGRPNTSARGARVQFQLIDASTKPSLTNSEVTVTIKSPYGHFPETDVILKCVSE